MLGILLKGALIFVLCVLLFKGLRDIIAGIHDKYARTALERYIDVVNMELARLGEDDATPSEIENIIYPCYDIGDGAIIPAAHIAMERP